MPLPLFDDDDVLRRAFAAHFRAVGPAGGIPMQPSARASAVEWLDGKPYVVLRSGPDVLRVYRVRNDGKLKALRRWPAELRG